MESGAAALFVGAAVTFLLGSALWAHYRFADYDQLPRQFSASLKPVAYGPPWIVIWLTPLIMIAALVLILALPAFVPPQFINGDPVVGAIIASVATVTAQGFILWLLARWARGQA